MMLGAAKGGFSFKISRDVRLQPDRITHQNSHHIRLTVLIQPIPIIINKAFGLRIFEDVFFLVFGVNKYGIDLNYPI